LQASRLDDQRGMSSPSCFELPEFLKIDRTVAVDVSVPMLLKKHVDWSDKEAFVAPVGKPPQKPRRGVPKLGLASPVYRSSVKTPLKTNMFDFV
jgi:hypothetical protein